MRRELIASLILHVAVLLIAAGSFVSVSAPPPPKPVAVSIVTPSELSRLKAGRKSVNEEQPEVESIAVSNRQEKPDVQKKARIRNNAPAERKVAAPAKQAALPPPRHVESSPPREVTKTITRAVPVPARAERSAPRRHERKRPPPRVERKRPDRIAHKPRQPPRQPQYRKEPEQFDADRIAALLNRDPNARPVPREPERRLAKAPWRKPRSFEEQAFGEQQEQVWEQRAAYGSPDGRDDRMSANEIDAFRAQISRCWTPPVGGLGGDRIIVKLRIGLNKDGSLALPPAIANRVVSPYFRPAAESALRAVMQCQPYRMPPEKYDQWRDMLLTFDPRQMYGG